MGKHLSSLNQKVEWLIVHPEVWRGWPRFAGQDDLIIEAMRKDGIVSQGAHNFDIGDLGKPIAEARMRIRGNRNKNL